MKYFNANVVGHSQTGRMTPAILGSLEKNPHSHKIYIDTSEQQGRWTKTLRLEEEGFIATDVAIAIINLENYRSVEIWFEVDHRLCRSDTLAPVYVRMEWTAATGWDITNLVYQRGSSERVIRPARIGVTTL